MDSTPAEPIGTREPADSGAAERRFARTWVNVHARRSASAPVVRIVNPGELVMVDLFQQGWYRVVEDGQAVGYMDGHYLDRSPPAGPP